MKQQWSVLLKIIFREEIFKLYTQNDQILIAI